MEDEMEEKIYSAINKLLLIGFGIALIDLTIINQSKGGNIVLNTAVFSQLSIALIFGFLHMLKTFPLLEKVKLGKVNVLDNLYLVFIYTAWYNIILFPLSGIGVVEWGLVAFILLSDFLLSLAPIKKHKKDDRQEASTHTKLTYIIKSNMSLLFIGIILYLLKNIVFFLFPDNIYAESFVGNSTARNLVFIFALMGLIMLLSNVTNLIKSNYFWSKETQEKAGKGIARLGKTFSKFVKKVITLLSGWALLVIAVFLVGLGIFFLISLRNDILNFVEPYLAKLLSTGKNSIIPSTAYTLYQAFALLSILIFTFWLNRYIVEESRKVASKIIAQTLVNQEYLNPQKRELYFPRLEKILIGDDVVKNLLVTEKSIVNELNNLDE